MNQSAGLRLIITITIQALIMADVSTQLAALGHTLASGQRMTVTGMYNGSCRNSAAPGHTPAVCNDEAAAAEGSAAPLKRAKRMSSAR